MAELADAADSKSAGTWYLAGSIPVPGTTPKTHRIAGCWVSSPHAITSAATQRTFCQCTPTSVKSIRLKTLSLLTKRCGENSLHICCTVLSSLPLLTKNEHAGTTGQIWRQPEDGGNRVTPTSKTWAPPQDGRRSGPALCHRREPLLA